MIDIIYIRTSTEQQNPENQLADVQAIAPPEAKIFRDTQGAWKDNPRERQEFREVLKLIRAGQARSFNVWDLDRVYRNRRATVEFMQLCQAKGVVVRSYRQHWLQEFEKIPAPWNEIMHQFIINVFGWMAEEESQKKSERVKIAYRNHQGKKWGRPTLPPTTVSQVRDLLAKGASYRSVQKQVTYHLQDGRKIKHPSVAKISEIAKELRRIS